MQLEDHHLQEEENLNYGANNMLQEGRTKRDRIIAAWFN